MSSSVDILVAAVALLIVGVVIIDTIRRYGAKGQRERTQSADIVVEVGPPNSESVISLRRLPDRVPSGEPISLVPSLRAALRPVLEHAPRLLAAAADVAANGTRLALRFSAATMTELASRTAEVMPSGVTPGAWRAIARNVTNGRIIEQGELVTKVNPTTLAMAVWQVAAIVTAQKFLADIDAKLGQIGTEIHRIQDFLNDKEVSKLEGNLRYLRLRSQALQSGELSTSEHAVITHELDAIDRESTNIFQLYKRQLARLTDDVAGGEWAQAGWWGTASQRQHLSDEMERATQMLSAAALAGITRYASIGLRVPFGLAEGHTLRLVEDLRRDLAGLDRDWKRFETAVEGTVPVLKARFQRETTDERDRAEVLRLLKTRSEATIADLRRMSDLVGEHAPLGERLKPALEISLVVDGRGEIVEARHLPSSR